MSGGPTFRRTGNVLLNTLAAVLEEAISTCPNSDAWGDENAWPDGRSIAEVIDRRLEAIAASIKGAAADSKIKQSELTAKMHELKRRLHEIHGSVRTIETTLEGAEVGDDVLWHVGRIKGLAAE